ncbi:MAG: trigger factor [Rickettsiales bacterium]|jgi:trigger factor|nr:trigger factor [Rickettsiales bacterium]
MIRKDKNRDLHWTLVGALAASDIESASNEILMKYGEKAKLPGFRPGHIPMSVLKTKFGADAWYDAVNKSIQSDLDGFIADKKLRLAAAPKLDTEKPIKVGEAAEYTLEFDVLPELPKLDLEKISLTKKVAEVADSEIEKALANLAKSRAQYEKSADETRRAAKGDIAVIDFKGFVGSEAFAGGEAKKHHLELGSNQFIAGFEDQVMGHKVGEKFDVNVKFPENYGAPNLAGKAARFEIEIHEVRVPNTPAIDDELAKSVGQESVAALRGHIKKLLAEQAEAAAKKQMKEELLGVLADKVKMDLPESLVAREVEYSREENPEKFNEKEARKEAERRVKLGLILAEWGRLENITVGNQEVQQSIFTEAYQNGANPQQVLEYYQKNEGALNQMRGVLFEQKVLDAMVERTKK